MWHVCGRVELHTEFWWGNVRKKYPMEDEVIGGEDILAGILKKEDERSALGLSGSEQGQVVG
jgi:hypothetical protein